MKEKVFFFSIRHPLLLILLFAMALKVVAAVFTGGYIFDNEYFNYYKVPASLLENKWLVFSIRLILATFSLLVITFSYRIVKVISNRKTALETAFLLAFLWFMPYVSAHPLHQAVTMPFLLYGTLLIVKQDYLLSIKEIEKFHRTTFIIAGFFLGLGFSVWYQSILYYIGIIIALLVLKNWKGVLMTIIGFVIAVCITQSIFDLFIWGKPFVNMIEFFKNSGVYLFSRNIQTPWFYYSFLMILIGMAPPLSLMVTFGFFKVWRKYLLLFLPTFLFLLYYMVFPNTNGIYILPIIPTFVICGFVGWKEFKRKSVFWTKNKRLLLYLNVLAAIVNLVFMVLIFIKTYNFI